MDLIYAVSKALFGHEDFLPMAAAIMEQDYEFTLPDINGPRGKFRATGLKRFVTLGLIEPQGKIKNSPCYSKQAHDLWSIIETALRSVRRADDGESFKRTLPDITWAEWRSRAPIAAGELAGSLHGSEGLFSLVCWIYFRKEPCSLDRSDFRNARMDYGRIHLEKLREARLIVLDSTKHAQTWIRTDSPAWATIETMINVYYNYTYDGERHVMRLQGRPVTEAELDKIWAVFSTMKASSVREHEVLTVMAGDDQLHYATVHFTKLTRLVITSHNEYQLPERKMPELGKTGCHRTVRAIHADPAATATCDTCIRNHLQRTLTYDRRVNSITILDSIAAIEAGIRDPDATDVGQREARRVQEALALAKLIARHRKEFGKLLAAEQSKTDSTD